jgi:hypothetical protein
MRVGRADVLTLLYMEVRGQLPDPATILPVEKSLMPFPRIEARIVQRIAQFRCIQVFQKYRRHLKNVVPQMGNAKQVPY